MKLANALCACCGEILGLPQDKLNVEFTQHSGDEMYHPALGGFSPEWEPGESSNGLDATNPSKDGTQTTGT
jgi:hypothetical protein